MKSRVTMTPIRKILAFGIHILLLGLLNELRLMDCFHRDDLK
jgi:hypothetical protein